MADDKKKSVAAMLVMGLKPKKKAGAPDASEPMPGEDVEGEEMQGGEGEEQSDHEAAASEVMDALKAGDVSGFAEALKSFVQMCHYDSEE